MLASARLSSSAASRKVIAGVSSAITRSCYRTSRGKAHAAPLPAQELPPKGQKKITVQERRVRIVEFVENYRASNDGKFPTVTNIRQQVGGSYYTVRAVLQEMEYNLRVKDPTDKPDPGFQQREIEAKKVDLKNPEKPQNANDSNASDQRGSDIVNVAKTHASSFGMMNYLDLARGLLLPLSVYNWLIQAVEDESSLGLRDDNPKHEESANTGLLGSLKSFAYGIRNLWKNM